MDLRGLETKEWRGFSDTEIKKLQQEGNENSNKVENRLHIGLTKASNNKPPRRMIKKTLPTSPVTSEQQTISQKPIAKPKQVVKPVTSTVVVQTKDDNSEKQDSKSSPTKTEGADTPTQPVREEPPTVEFKEESCKLEELQARQREIEAENKRTKALIEQKLTERARIHKEESHKLQIVSQELAKLDKLVSKDVSVLREKIEEANRLYNSARRRFELAEAEYISSKAALFQCSEQKELLSEHLCAVIQQNETRKASKLSELMKTLNIENGEEDENMANTEQPTTPVFLRTPTPALQHWHNKNNTDGKKSDVMDASQVTKTDSSDNVNTDHVTCTAGVGVTVSSDQGTSISASTNNTTESDSNVVPSHTSTVSTS